MAEGLNHVILIGNLGADPELRYTQSGTPILNMRVATTESFLDANKERQERTEWHTVVVWGKRGESLSKFLSKGSRVSIVGGLRTRSWEAEGGGKRYATEVVAQRVLLLGSRRPSQDDPSSGAPPPPDDDFGDDDIPF